MEPLEVIIFFHETRLNNLEKLVNELGELVKNTETTNHINQELDMQRGELSIANSTLIYLKQLNDKKR